MKEDIRSDKHIKLKLKYLGLTFCYRQNYETNCSDNYCDICHCPLGQRDIADLLSTNAMDNSKWHILLSMQLKTSQFCHYIGLKFNMTYFKKCPSIGQYYCNHISTSNLTHLYFGGEISSILLIFSGQLMDNKRIYSRFF